MSCREGIAGLVTAILTTVLLIGSKAVSADTQVIPSITVSERYDSNVFFGFAGPGVDPADYVTNVSPGINVAHQSQLVEGSVQGRLTAETYVKNPGLNYVAASGGVDLTLNRAVEQILRDAALGVSYSFLFTPQSPAFLTPEASGVSEAFVRGIQATRANMFANTVSASGSYLLSPNTKLQSKYQYSTVRFGTAFATPGTGSLIPKTTLQTGSAGSEHKISPLDTLSPSYQYQQVRFQAGGVPAFNFETHGVNLAWTRSLTPTLQASLGTGLAMIIPSQQIQYLAFGSLEWKLRNSSTKLSYSRQIIPAFFVTTGPMISQLYSLTVSHSLTERLTVTGNANYALNESSPTGLLRFETYSGGLVMNYLITNMVTANASYNYSDFDSSFMNSSFKFDRHVAMVSIKAEWK